MSESVLLAAENIVNGEEQKGRKYGPPVKSFEMYARIFNEINPGKIRLRAIDIAYVMLSVKLGRERTAHKVDNIIDACGYHEIINQIKEDEERIFDDEDPYKN